MKVYALVGKSGTGKSHHSMWVARENNIDHARAQVWRKRQPRRGGGIPDRAGGFHARVHGWENHCADGIFHGSQAGT